MTTLKNRYDFTYLFDVADGNPNGDPDAGNAPRQDPETQHALVTDCCLKRKIRNYVDMLKQGSDGYKIYVRENAVLSEQQALAYDALKIPLNAKNPDIPALRKWMCENFFDVRTFGAVMSTTNTCGTVRGPVQLGIARSIDPVQPVQMTITRMAVTNAKEAEKNEVNQTMGNKWVLPYALFRVNGSVSAALLNSSKNGTTGFSEDDLVLLWKALENMFTNDRSAARGMMSPRGLFVFKHASALGNARFETLYSSISVVKKVDHPRTFSEYDVSMGGVPEGVERVRLI
jgi:CRISPR-associated protein Csd2